MVTQLSARRVLGDFLCGVGDFSRGRFLTCETSAVGDLSRGRLLPWEISAVGIVSRERLLLWETSPVGDFSRLLGWEISRVGDSSNCFRFFNGRRKVSFAAISLLSARHDAAFGAGGWEISPVGDFSNCSLPFQRLQKSIICCDRAIVGASSSGFCEQHPEYCWLFVLLVGLLLFGIS